MPLKIKSASSAACAAVKCCMTKLIVLLSLLRITQALHKPPEASLNFSSRFFIPRIAYPDDTFWQEYGMLF